MGKDERPKRPQAAASPPTPKPMPIGPNVTRGRYVMEPGIYGEMQSALVPASDGDVLGDKPWHRSYCLSIGPRKRKE